MKRITFDEDFGPQYSRLLTDYKATQGRILGGPINDPGGPCDGIHVCGRDSATLYSGKVRFKGRLAPVWCYTDHPVVVWTLGEPPDCFLPDTALCSTHLDSAGWDVCTNDFENCAIERVRAALSADARARKEAGL